MKKLKKTKAELLSSLNRNNGIEIISTLERNNKRNRKHMLLGKIKTLNYSAFKT